MGITRWMTTGLLGLMVAGAMTAGTGEALAAKGTVGTVPGTCGALTVTNTGQIVKNYAMPDIKYAVSNCGDQPLAATVRVTEIASFLSDPCPSPTAAPAPVALPVGGKVAASAPVYRSACGFRGSGSGVILAGELAWQGHNLQLDLVDNATGAVLSTAYFSWSDAPTRP